MSNPLKVYAQESRRFEKPLFFFHVIAQGGQNSSRPRNLESQYGKNNYKIYLLGSDQATSFLCDVLNQHVRVRETVDYIALYKLLNSALWSRQVNYVSILKHATNLDLSKNDILSSYIHLARGDSRLIPDLMDILKAESINDFQGTEDLNTYLGSGWAIPIFCAMAIGKSHNEEEVEYWSGKLLDWQNKSSYMPMLTPAFGLSEDYDEFILGCAPQLITLIIAVANRRGGFICELICILTETLERLGTHWFGLNTAIYLLQLSACLKMKNEFEIAKNYLCEFAELLFDDVLNPPSLICVTGEGFLDNFQQGSNLEIPSYLDFISLCVDKYQSNESTSIMIALKALDDDAYIYEWSKDLLTALWFKNC